MESLRPEGALLRVRDQRSGKDYLRVVETQHELKAKDAAIAKSDHRADLANQRVDLADQRAHSADQRADREAAARRSAEARLAALEASLGQVGQRPLDDD